MVAHIYTDYGWGYPYVNEYVIDGDKLTLYVPSYIYVYYCD